MKRYYCVCGNPLFFESVSCVRCQREVGWCAGCNAISALEPHPENGFVCTSEGCGQQVLKCVNYIQHNVCNRTVLASAPSVDGRCDYCRFNHTIPNLEDPTNQMKWARIEAAKRRVLYGFDRLGIPYGSAEDGVNPPLVFEFKSDSSNDSQHFRDVAGGETVYTGHDNGVITLNLKEADPVHREKSRVEFGEAHRTLVGHFRHEMGHYFWDVAIKGQREAEFTALFGDHTVSYADALSAYYQNGPKPGWPTEYVSAYATMHPWEDFAETFANYLDLMATIETAREGRMTAANDTTRFELLAAEYVRLGLVLNELNRGIGLVDFLPEIIVDPVKRKMKFIHDLTRYGKHPVQIAKPAATEAAPAEVAQS